MKRTSCLVLVFLLFLFPTQMFAQGEGSYSENSNRCKSDYFSGKDFKESYTIVNGVKISYSFKQAKSNDTVVFIHGAFVNKNSLYPVASNFHNTNVILIDLPGHGKSDGPAVNTLSGYADVVQATIEKLQSSRVIGSNVVIAGWSMGGSIAAELGQRNLSYLKKIILINSAPVWNFPPIPKEAFDFKALLPTEFTSATSESVKKSIINDFNTIMAPIDTCMTDIAALNTFDVTKSFSSINKPTLIITGDKDHIANLSSVSSYTGIPESYLNVVPNRGHNLVIEAPSKVSECIDEFLKYTNK